METQPVKQPVLFNKIQVYFLECMLAENKNENLSENEKVLECIKNYSKTFRALWLEYENKD